MIYDLAQLDLDRSLQRQINFGRKKKKKQKHIYSATSYIEFDNNFF